MPAYFFRFVWFLCLLPLGVSAQFKYYEKGYDQYTAGKYTAAIENFSLYLTKNTRDKALDPEVFYLRALAYYKTNDFAHAIPDFEETILRDHANKGNIYWFKAKAHDKLGASADAIDAYSAALRLLGTQSEPKAKLLYERSQLYVRTGQLPLAYDDLKEGSLAAPGNADIKRELDKLEKQGVASRSSTPDAGTSKTTTAGNTTTVSTKNTKPAGTQSLPRTETKTPAARKDTAPTKKEPDTTPVVATTLPVVPTQPSLADEYKNEKRYALVIGNSAYPKAVGVLKNPVNDASDMAKELQASNFDVTLLTNATYGQIRAALLRFKDKIDAGDKDNTVALFYFAGHGVRHEEENYLVPVDASVEFEDDIARYCFPTQRMVLGNMERSNARMNIVILDACRNNPFPAVNRSLSGGLGEMRRARGSFIAYATAPGSVAADGGGRNGLYTQELLKAMRKPGLTIEQVFKEVRANVLRLSANKQNTWDSSNIVGEFYFKFN
ncbi:caspase family protein [Parachryseolinea silvisoli]|uniref:caspase family protein n=1 Tax=Parachryseolinea silvisoli TaxID=2873601 RepID=UPI0022658CDD|nr:caspase family protein [Parachryseolinea silvisoli]MCD9018132.1 caspase family protein [Parachryseolinea silvisoli]